jgi:hypothetical protein
VFYETMSNRLSWRRDLIKLVQGGLDYSGSILAAGKGPSSYGDPLALKSLIVAIPAGVGYLSADSLPTFTRATVSELSKVMHLKMQWPCGIKLLLTSIAGGLGRKHADLHPDGECNS